MWPLPDFTAAAATAQADVPEAEVGPTPLSQIRALQGSAVEYAGDLDVGTVSEGRVNGNFWPDLVDELGLPLLGKDHRMGISNRHGMDDRASGPAEIESVVRVQGSRVESDGLGSMRGAAHLR